MSRQNLRIAFWIWFVQIVVVYCCALFNWHHLVLWDSSWYGHIVDNGYQSVMSPDPYKKLGNVGFFPGYPGLSWLFKTLFCVSTDVALLLTSSSMCIATWFFFGQYFDFNSTTAWPSKDRSTIASSTNDRQRAGRVSAVDPVRLNTFLWLAAYQFTFFFVLGYSESLTVATILGFILFSEHWLRGSQEQTKRDAVQGADSTSFLLDTKDTLDTQSTLAAHTTLEATPTLRFNNWTYFAFAAACGFLMCSTRLLASIFVFYPAVRAIQLNFNIKTILKSSALSFTAASGAILFFVYCYFKFGAWDFYMITEKANWGTFVDWNQLLSPKDLFTFSPILRSDSVGKIITLLIGVFLCVTLFKSIKRRVFRDPYVLKCILCLLFWAAHVIGRTSWAFQGMGRYLIPILFLLAPHWRLPSLKGTIWKVAFVFLILLQLFYAAKFARNGWVA